MNFSLVKICWSSVLITYLCLSNIIIQHKNKQKWNKKQSSPTNIIKVLTNNNRFNSLRNIFHIDKWTFTLLSAVIMFLFYLFFGHLSRPQRIPFSPPFIFLYYISLLVRLLPRHPFTVLFFLRVNTYATCKFYVSLTLNRHLAKCHKG